MYSIALPWLTAVQTALTSQLSGAITVGRHAIDGATSLFDLNAEAGRAWMAHATAAAQQALAVRSPHELLLISSEHSQSSLDSLHAYGAQTRAASQQTRLAIHAAINSEIAASRQKIDDFIVMTRQTPVPFLMPINTFFKTAF